jgi:Mrr N-terminal domain
MAMNYSDYPENWGDIRAQVLERAKNDVGISQCECFGECGREHRGTRCLHVQYSCLTTRSKYKVILTTAHLCHDTKCARLDHLKSMCQPCHQIFDLRDRQKREAGGESQKLSRKTRLQQEEKKPRLEPKRMVQLQVGTNSTTIPNGETLMLPALRLLADGRNHSSGQIREHLGVEFGIAPTEGIQKLKNGKTTFHSNIDLALAYLQGAPQGRSKAIERVKPKVYRITEYGKSLLKRSLLTLRIKDLQSWL